MDINFDIYEIDALVAFLKEYVDKESLPLSSRYSTLDPRHLFLAFLKLQKAQDAWEEGMKYTE